MLTRQFTGYKTIHGPEQLHDPNQPSRPISSPADYRGWHAAMVTTKGVDPWDSNKKCTARINHGRWIADCIWCKGPILTRPDWGVAYCAECGARYHEGSVIFPANPRLFAEPLLLRVQRELQNWAEPQKLEALWDENKRLDVKTVDDILRENIADAIDIALVEPDGELTP